MNVVPAQAAGVALDRGRQPAAARPRRPARPAILAACALLGVDEVYAVGGAQAIAMFAYGTESCPRADGHRPRQHLRRRRQAAAARRIGIDSEAGPTEIAILADDTRRPGATSPPT